MIRWPKRALGVRSAVAVAALALATAALSVVPSQPAEAQSAVTLVSNTGQTRAGEYALSNEVVGQAFTAGDNADGYTLTEIAASLRINSTDIDESLIKAQLWSVVGAGEGPGSKLADLTVPSSISQGTSAVSFTAPSGTTLTASTEYRFVLWVTDATEGGKVFYQYTSSTDEDTGAASGWSIKDDQEGHLGSGPPQSPDNWGAFGENPVQIAVKGTATQATASAGVTVSESTLEVAKDATATYTVVLDSEPTANVTVSPTSGTTAKATVAPASRVFTTSNWETPQMFTVTGVAAGTSTITHAATSTDSNYNGVSIGSVSVTVPATPPSTLTLSTNASSDTVAEGGGSVTVTATLDETATQAVSVTLASDSASTAETGDYTLPSAFTIAAGQSSATGTVQITDDKLDEDNETIVLTDTTSGLTVTPVTLTITDDDTAGVTLSTNTVSVAENATTTYTVVLDSQPTSVVTVTATSGTTAKATVSAAVDFTTANWDQAKTFTVTGVDAGTSAITHAATSNDTDYAINTVGTVTATVTTATQSATPPSTLTLSTNASSDTVAEGGGSVTVTATLDETATQAVSVTLASDSASTAETGDYTLPSAFTIAAGQSSATGTVQITDDKLDEDNETIVLTDTTSGLTVTPVTLTITDDDTAGVTLSTNTVSVAENATTTYTVVLDSQPTSVVTVTATSGTTAKATVSAAVDFTTANWDQAKTFTVTGVDAGTSAITHAATSNDTDYAINTVGTVTATVTTATKTFQVEPTKTVAEGATAELTVTLGEAAPTGGLTLGVAYDYSGSTATSADLGSSPPSSLRVSAGATTATLSIPTRSDAILEGDETFTVTLSTAASDWAGVSGETSSTVTITDDDDDSAAIGFGTSGRTTAYTASVAENVSGGTLTVPIQVSHLPQVSTTVAVGVRIGGTATEWQSAESPGDFWIETKSVTFTPSGNRTQNLTVTITDDLLVEDDQTILLGIAAADSPADDLGDYYSRHSDGATGTVTIEDDEQHSARIAFGTAATRTSAYTATGEEVVGSLSVPVTVSHLPETDTAFTVEVLDTSTARESDDPQNATGNPEDFEIASKTVTFGPTTATSMNIEVTIRNDTVEEDDETIRLRVVTADSQVDDLGDYYSRHSTGATARVTVRSEDQVAEVTLSTTATGLGGVSYRAREGTSMTLTATSDIPAGPGGWTVTPAMKRQASAGPGIASPADVRFTPFTIPQGQTTATGTVTFVQDALVEPSEVLLIQGSARRRNRTLAATLEGLTRTGGLFVNIVDASAGATVSATSLEMIEQEQVTYEVWLNTAPTADVTVTPSSSAVAVATTSGALTFTSANYADPQEVTVTGVGDGTATITHAVASSDSAYHELTTVLDVSVKVLEPAETFSLAVTDTGESTATGTEGTPVGLQVTLDALAPTGGIEFTVDQAGDGGSGDTPATVTVPEGERRSAFEVSIDDNSAPEAASRTVTVTVATSAPRWAAKTSAANQVRITFGDDDDATIAFGSDPAAADAYADTVEEDVAASTLLVPVTISSLPAEATTFGVRVLSGSTATVRNSCSSNGADYVIADREVTFGAPGDTDTTKNLTVEICDDDAAELDETIRLGFAPISAPARSVADRYRRRPAGDLQAVITIDSEDAPAPGGPTTRRQVRNISGPTGNPGPGGPGGPIGGGGGGNPDEDEDEDEDDRDTSRLWGADRYATSLRIAEQVAEANDGKLATIVLAGGHSWTDALAAAPLAGALDGALLLTAPDGLAADTITWLEEVGVTEIIAVGDNAHIPDAALDALRAALNNDDGGDGGGGAQVHVERIAQDSPYAVSAAVAARIGQPDTLGPLLGRTVIVASGRKFPDALAAGPLAAAGPHPVLYADQGELHPEVAAYLAAHADHVIIMGGTAAVDDQIEAQIRAIKQANRPARPMAVTRHAGTDRYHTAALFARWLTGRVLEGRTCFTADTAGLATGTNPADAAASGPLLAHRCAPLLLTQPHQMPTHTASYLRNTTELIIFGGTKAINNTALRDWTQ